MTTDTSSITHHAVTANDRRPHYIDAGSGPAAGYDKRSTAREEQPERVNALPVDFLKHWEWVIRRARRIIAGRES